MTVQANNNILFSPNLNFTGPASFTYVAKDGLGAASATPATVYLNVTAVNDAPVNTAPASVTASEDVAFVFTAATRSALRTSTARRRR